MRSVCASGLGTPSSLRPFALIGILGNGQSLSTGDYGTPVLSTSQPYSNVQLHDSGGTYSTPASGTWSRIALIAPVRADKYAGGGGDVAQYPGNIGGESPDVAMSNTITALSGSLAYAMLPSNVGQGGASYTVIQKSGTGNAYQSLLNEITVAAGMAVGYGAGLAILTHGEADAAVSAGTYSAWLAAYQSGLQTDAKALTGQARNIPLILSQQNAFPAVGSGANQSALEQVAAVQSHATSIYLSGPKYQYSYQTDRAHLTAASYRLLGEKYGQVGWRILSGLGWTSFVPASTIRSGNNVTVTFNVPFGPLQWSSAFTAPHASGALSAWSAGKGFEARTGGAAGSLVTINSVTIQNGNQVVIACATQPDTIAYAHTPDNTTGGTYTGGFPDGRCGLLTDSDPFVGPITSTAQPNYCPELQVTGL